MKIFSWSAVGCCNTFIHRSFVDIPAELLHVITGKSYCTLSVQTISIPLNSLLNSSMQYATISNFLQHTLEIFSYFIFILTTFINFHPALLDFENRYQQFCRDLMQLASTYILYLKKLDCSGHKFEWSTVNVSLTYTSLVISVFCGSLLLQPYRVFLHARVENTRSYMRAPRAPPIIGPAQ